MGPAFEGPWHPHAGASSLRSERILDTLSSYLNDRLAEAVLETAVAKVGADYEDVRTSASTHLLEAIDNSLRFCLPDRDRRECLRDLDELLCAVGPASRTSPARPADIPIRSDADIVIARAAARDVCAAAGLSPVAGQAVLVVLTQLAQTLLPAKTGKIGLGPVKTGHLGVEIAVDGVPEGIARAIPAGMSGLMDEVDVVQKHGRGARVRCVKHRG
jgi:hypothetical protein